MREEDVNEAGNVLAQEYKRQTALHSHEIRQDAIESVYDETAKEVTCPACSTVFTPDETMVCPSCGLGFG